MIKPGSRSSGSLATKMTVIFGLGFLFFGCASKEINIQVHGNQDMNGGGYAVSVNVYQLKNDATFRLLPVEAFFQEDNQALQADIVDKIPLTIIPGETKPVLLKISESTRYIGAAANFHKPDKEGWRDIFPLDSGRPKEIWIVIQADRIKISKG